MKLSSVRTKTVTADTAQGLDGAVRAFVEALGEDQLLVIRFATRTTKDGTSEYAAFLVYA